MQCEADEQYALLVELQKADAQFNDILYEFVPHMRNSQRRSSTALLDHGRGAGIAAPR